MNDFVKPKLLVLAMHYYPIENANVAIIKRLSLLLAQTYNIVIATPNTESQTVEEIEAGIKIIRTPMHAFNKRVNTHNNSFSDLAHMILFKGLKKLQWSDIEKKDAYFFLKEICKIINIEQFDLILTFTSPFTSHYCASIISKKYNVPWIAYYLDPYFSNATYDSKRFKDRKAFEERTLSAASRILMTYPTNENYIKYGVSFRDKIVMVEMPGIQNKMRIDNRININNTDRIQCYFVGNLYKDIRNPETVIKLFSLLNDTADLYFVGGSYSSAYDLESMSTDNIHFVGKKCEEEIPKIYSNADILINIGNTIDNQMPSKIFEYISTGKPIINFYKTVNCPTLKYLNKYPLALNIFEEDLFNDIETHTKIIKEFCIHNQEKTVPYSLVKEVFKSNTDKMVAAFLSQQMMEIMRSKSLQVF